MYKLKEDTMKVPCYVWSEKGTIEQGAIDQIKNVASLPFLFGHVALMSDAHQGFGCPIGSVVATKGVIIPNLAGSDIGCGVCAAKTSLTEIETETIKKIIGEIRKVVPVGFGKHKEEQDIDLMPLCEAEKNENKGDLSDLPIVEREYESALKQIGTLGGGNHFISIEKGSDGHIWIMIHSGSRNLGLQVATYYNRIAQELNEKWYSSVPKEWDLAFLPIDSEEGQMYFREMQYCVDFALANRKLMMDRIIKIFGEVLSNGKEYSWGVEPMINIAHNYISLENHYSTNVYVHRKGATLASNKTIGIIPGSQGTHSYLVRGLGNEESFFSCSHGAGRAMSRKKAIETLDLADEQKKMEGIIHSVRNKSNLDESVSAYKDIEYVMSQQKDLVEIITQLSPLASIKG